MALPLRNACTGTDETTVTTGNSGGSSGTAWDACFIGTNASCVYETATSIASSSCIRISTGATSTTVTPTWTTGAVRQYGRIYWACANYTTTPCVFRVRSGGTQTCRVTVSSTGNVQIRNTSNTVVATGAATLSTNTWYQFRFDVARGSSADVTVWVYHPTTNALIDTITATAQNFGTGTPGEWTFGVVTNTPSHPALYIDEIYITDTGPVGPVSQSHSIADGVTAADSPAAAIAGNHAAADGVTAADSPAWLVVPHIPLTPPPDMGLAAGRPADYVLLFTEQDLEVVGYPVICWTQLDLTLRFNEPASGIAVMPAYPWIVAQIVEGRRIVVIRNGQVLLAGPIEGWLLERSDDGENAGDGKVTINFADDLARIAGREVYPNPAETVETQTSDQWTFSGNAEVALRTLVDANAGPGALAARQIPHLQLGTLAGVGSSVTVTATRMQHLGDLARKIAEVGGELGFRTRQEGSVIFFEVYACPDRSGEVRFGFGLGNLQYIAFEVRAPTATTAIVGGQGEGSDKAMIERSNTGEEAAWGRVERLVSRPGSTDLAELEDDATRALAEGAATTRLATNVRVSGLTLPSIGDIVAIESWPGQQVTGVIRTLHFQVYATSGEFVAATVGSQAATTDPEWVQRMREVDERLGRLERTVVPAA